MRGFRGFTLVEVLIVVVILSIVASAAVMLVASPRRQLCLRDAADRLVADIELTQRDAVARAEWRSIHFDAAHQRYSVRGPAGALAHPVSKATFAVDLASAFPGIVLRMDTSGLGGDSLRFVPSGEATSGGRVAFEAGGTRVEVLVAGSGRVTTAETSSGGS